MTRKARVIKTTSDMVECAINQFLAEICPAEIHSINQVVLFPEDMDYYAIVLTTIIYSV